MPSSQLIQVGIKFNADTSLAKQLIVSLQLTLQQLITNNSSLRINGGSIDLAVLSAKLLQIALLNAVNVDTGKLDFSKFNTTLKALGTDVVTIGIKLNSIGTEGQRAFALLGNAIATAEIPARRMNSTLMKFGDTLLRTIRWQVASTMIHGFISTVRSAVSYIEDLDQSLNSILRITLKNDTEMANFAKTASKMADLLSTVTKEYSNASLIFFQQGLDTAEVIERTNATIKLAKVTGDSVENISSKLTAIWNNFDDGTKSLEYYADVITKLGASTASSSDEIATGLLKFAAVADTVGLSYERATAALATVVALTRQSAEIVGTSFKTIFARVEGLKLGETLEDDVTLNQYSAALAKIGVNILDSNNNLKDMDTILDDLGDKWNKLTEALKVATAQTVAGVRQYSQFLALMDNYELVKANEDLAKESEGTLDKLFDVYLDSMEALNKEIQKAKEDIYSNLFDKDMLKDFKETIKYIFNMVENIVKNFGGLKGIITTIGALILSNYMPQIVNGFSNFIANFRDSWGFTRRDIEKTTELILSMLQTAGAGVLSGSKDVSSASTGGSEVEAALASKILLIRQEITKNADYYTETLKAALENLMQDLIALKDALVASKEELSTLLSKNLEEEALLLRRTENANRKGENLAFGNINSNNTTTEMENIDKKIKELKNGIVDYGDEWLYLSEVEKLAATESLNQINELIKKLELVRLKLVEIQEIQKTDPSNIKLINSKINEYKQDEQVLQVHLNEIGYLQQLAQVDAGLMIGASDNTMTMYRDLSDSLQNSLSTMQEMKYTMDEVTGNITVAKESTDGFKENLASSLKNMRDLSKLAGEYRATSKQVKKITENINSDYKIRLNDMNKLNKGTKEYARAEEGIKKSLNVIVNLAKELVTSLKNSGKQGVALKNEIANVEKAITNISEGKGTTEDLLIALDALGQTSQTAAQDLGLLAESMAKDLANGSREAEQGFLRTIQSMEDEGEKAEFVKHTFEELRYTMSNFSVESPKAFATLGKGLTEGVLGLTSMSMGVNLLLTGFDQLADSFVENTGFIGKMTAAIMILRGAMIAVKGATAAWNAVKAISKGLSLLFVKNINKETAAVETNTTALGVNATMSGVANAAKKGGVIAAAAAAVAMAGITAGVLGNKINARKALAEAEATAKKAEAAAETAKQAADEAEDAFKLIEEDYKKFEDLYKEYSKTGEASTDLYDISKTLIEQLGLEGDMVLLLAGRYDLLSESIKNATLEKGKETAAEQAKSVLAAQGAITANANKESGGFLTNGIESGYLGLSGGSWRDTKDYVKGLDSSVNITSEEDLNNWLKDRYKGAIKSVNDTILFTDDALGYAMIQLFQEDMAKGRKDFDAHVKKGTDKATRQELINMFTTAGYTNAEDLANKYQDYTYDRLASVFDAGGSDKANLMKHEIARQMGTHADYINDAWLKALETGDLDKLKEFEEGFKTLTDLAVNLFAMENEIGNVESIDNLNNILNLAFDENGDLKKGTILFDTIASGIIKDYEAGLDLSEEELILIQNLAKQYLPDLQNRIKNMSNLSAAYTVEQEMQNLYKRRNNVEKAEGIDFDTIAKEAEMTVEEILDLFSSGLIDLTKIDWSVKPDEIVDQVVNAVKKAQEAVNELPIEVKFTMVQDALKNWKKDMSYTDYLSWIETNKGLFGENGIIDDMSLEKFLELSYEEQLKILSTSLTTKDVAKFAQLQADLYSKYIGANGKLTDAYWQKDNEYLNEEEYRRNILNKLLGDLSSTIETTAINETEGGHSERKEIDFSQILLSENQEGLTENLIRIKDTNGKDYIIDLGENRKAYYNALGGADLAVKGLEEEVKTQAEAFKEEAKYAPTIADASAFTEAISRLGLNSDETRDYLEYLQSINEELAKNPELAKKVALAIKAQEKGFKDASDHLEDYLAVLELGDKTTTEYAKLLNLFLQDLSLLFNREDLDNDVAKMIFDDIEAMELFKLAIEGSDEAWLKFLIRAAMLELGISDYSKTEIDDYLALLAATDIEIGAIIDIDEAPFLNSLYNLLLESGYTVEQIENLFKQMGYEPEWDTETVGTTRTYTAASHDRLALMENKTADSHLETTSTVTSTITYPVLKGARKTSVPKPASTFSPKKDNGGGGGGERSKKEPKKESDEIERYHKLNKTLDSLSKQYSRISSAKDAAFGALRLAYIEKENKLLQQQYNTEKALLKEIEQNYSKDRSAIEAYGAIIDQNGVITNYDQIMKLLLDKLNNAYAQYNAGGLSDEIIEAYEKEYEEFKKILSQFEETNSTYLDQLEKVEEAIRKQITNALEGIKAKVELELELPNQLLKIIEYKLQDLEDRAFSSSEKIALWSQLAEIAANSFGRYADAFKNVLTMSVYDAEGNKTGGFGLTADLADRLMSGDAEVLDEAGITGENAQEIMEALKEYQDNLLEEYSKVREARQSVEEELLNLLNEYTEAIDLLISKLEKLNSIANNYKTLINTTGKELLGISADIMNSINATIMNTSKNQIAVLKAELDALESNLADAREKLANALGSGDSEAILYWKNVNQEIENTLLETKDTLLSTINDFVENATEILQERIKESFDNFAKQIYGMTFEDAQASYDRYKTLSDDYLKDYQKIYELSKLTRQVEQSIDNTNNIKGKLILRDLQAEINEYLAEGVQMTRYEVDYLNKKYELRKAEIALEEAQNAKDQVRLSRNADGGWGYVYTANLQNIDKAQQTYEDKLYALQELNTKAIEDTLATILQLLTEYQNAMMEIWENKELSPEQISARVNELTDYYTRLINTQSETLNSALGNNNELYTEDWENYNKLTGYRISADENYIDKFEETWLGKLQLGITSALDFFELYKNTIGTYDNNDSILGQCYSAFEDYSSMVKESLSSAGLDLEDFAFVVSNEMNKIEESSKKAKDEGENLANLLSETLPNTMNKVESVLNKTTNMLNNMKLAIDGVNNALTLLILKLQEYNNTTITKKTFTPPESTEPTTPYVAPVESPDGGDGDKNPSGGNNGTWTWWVPSGSNLMSKTTGEASTKELAISDARDAYEFSFKENYKYYNNDSEAGYKKAFVASWTYMTTTLFDKYFKYIPPTFDTGGYTGAFGPEGRLAMLHEKELVLNKLDTSNMLKMIDIARQVIYDFNSSLPNFTAQTLSNALFDRSKGETNQNITIEAHFPNAVNHLEIEEAFRNLANYSAQNAYNLDLSQNINIF